MFFLDDDHYLNYISWFLPGKPWSFMESQRNSSSASNFNIFMCFFRWFFHSMHMSRRQAKWQTHRNNNPHAISCLIIVFSAISIFLTLPKFSRKQTSFEKNPLGSPTVDFDCPRDDKFTHCWRVSTDYFVPSDRVNLLLDWSPSTHYSLIKRKDTHFQQTAIPCLKLS